VTVDLILGDIVEFNFNHSYWTPGVIARVAFDQNYGRYLFDVKYRLVDGVFCGMILNIPRSAIRKLSITIEQADIDQRARDMVVASASPIRTNQEYAEQMSMAYAAVAKKLGC
jgi:hypothetical protein